MSNKGVTQGGCITPRRGLEVFNSEFHVNASKINKSSIDVNEVNKENQISQKKALKLHGNKTLSSRLPIREIVENGRGEWRSEWRGRRSYRGGPRDSVVTEIIKPSTAVNGTKSIVRATRNTDSCNPIHGYTTIPRESEGNKTRNNDEKHNHLSGPHDACTASDLHRNIITTGNVKLNCIQGNWTGQKRFVRCISGAGLSAQKLINNDGNLSEGNGRMSARVEVDDHFDLPLEDENTVGPMSSACDTLPLTINSIFTTNNAGMNHCGLLRNLHGRRIDSESMRKDENKNIEQIIPPSNIPTYRSVEGTKKERNNCVDGATRKKVVRISDDQEISIESTLINASDLGARESTKFVKTLTDVPSMSIKRSISPDCNEQQNKANTRVISEEQTYQYTSDKVINHERPLEARDDIVSDTESSPHSQENYVYLNRKSANKTSIQAVISQTRMTRHGANKTLQEMSTSNRGRGKMEENDKTRVKKPTTTEKTEIARDNKIKSKLPVSKCKQHDKCTGARELANESHEKRKDDIVTQGNTNALWRITCDDRTDTEVSSGTRQIGSEANTHNIQHPTEERLQGSLKSKDNNQHYVSTADIRGHADQDRPSQVNEEVTKQATQINRLRDIRLSRGSDRRGGSFVYWSLGVKDDHSIRRRYSAGDRYHAEKFSALTNSHLINNRDGVMDSAGHLVQHDRSTRHDDTDQCSVCKHADGLSDPECHVHVKAGSSVTRPLTSYNTSRYVRLGVHSNSSVCQDSDRCVGDDVRNGSDTLLSHPLHCTSSVEDTVSCHCVISNKQSRPASDDKIQKGTRPQQIGTDLNITTNKTVSRHKNTDEGAVKSSQIVRCKFNQSKTSDLKDYEHIEGSVKTCYIDSSVEGEPKQNRYRPTVVSAIASLSESAHDPPTSQVKSDLFCSGSSNSSTCAVHCKGCSPEHCFHSTILPDPTGIANDYKDLTSIGNEEESLSRTCASISNVVSQSENSLTFTEPAKCGNSLGNRELSSDREKIVKTEEESDWRGDNSCCADILQEESYSSRRAICTVLCNDDNCDAYLADDSHLPLLSDTTIDLSKQNKIQDGLETIVSTSSTSSIPKAGSRSTENITILSDIQLAELRIDTDRQDRNSPIKDGITESEGSSRPRQIMANVMTEGPLGVAHNEVVITTSDSANAIQHKSDEPINTSDVSVLAGNDRDYCDSCDISLRNYWDPDGEHLGTGLTPLSEGNVQTSGRTQDFNIDKNNDIKSRDSENYKTQTNSFKRVTSVSNAKSSTTRKIGQMDGKAIKQPESGKQKARSIPVNIEGVKKSATHKVIAQESNCKKGATIQRKGNKSTLDEVYKSDRSDKVSQNNRLLSSNKPTIPVINKQSVPLSNSTISAKFTNTKHSNTTIKPSGVSINTFHCKASSNPSSFSRSNSSSCSSSRTGSKEPTPDKECSFENSKANAVKRKQKSDNNKTRLVKPSIQIGSVKTETSAKANTAQKPLSQNVKKIHSNTNLELSGAVRDKKENTAASTLTKQCVPKVKTSASKQSTHSTTKSSQSSPALSRSSRSSTPMEARVPVHKNQKKVTVNRPLNTKQGLGDNTRFGLNSSSSGRATMRQTPSSSTDSKIFYSKQEKSVEKNPIKAVTKSKLTKSTAIETSSNTQKLSNSVLSSPALSRSSRSSTPKDLPLTKKIPVESKSTCSQESYDKSPVFQRKQKLSIPIKTKVVNSKIQKTNVSTSRTKDSNIPKTKSTLTNKVPNTKLRDSKLDANTRTVTPAKTSVLTRSSLTQNIARNKTGTDAKKNSEADINKTEDNLEKKIKIPTGDYLLNKKSVKSDSVKKLPSKSDLSPATSLTSLENKNKVQPNNSLPVEIQIDQKQACNMETVSRCAMPQVRDVNDLKAWPQEIESSNQTLSSGNLYAIFPNSSIPHDVLHSDYKADNVMKTAYQCRHSVSDTSEEYWSLSGDDNSECDKTEYKVFSETLENTRLSPEPLNYSLVSVDANEGQPIVIDKLLKQWSHDPVSKSTEEPIQIIQENPLDQKEQHMDSSNNQDKEFHSDYLDDNLVYCIENVHTMQTKEYTCNNKGTFDSVQENITHSSKCNADCDSLSVYSASVCNTDKEQYGALDLNSKIQEPTNSSEYSDEKLDKCYVLIREGSKGSSDPEALVNYLSDELAEGSKDRMSQLSMKNLMTHSQTEAGVCYIAQSVHDNIKGAGPLTQRQIEHSEIDTCTENHLVAGKIEHDAQDLINTSLNTAKSVIYNSDGNSASSTVDNDIYNKKNHPDLKSEDRSINHGRDESIHENEFYSLDSSSDLLESEYSDLEDDEDVRTRGNYQQDIHEGLIDANMNNMCIKTELTGDGTKKFIRQRRTITKHERSIKYETVATRISCREHSNENTFSPMTASSADVSTVQQKIDTKSRTLHSTCQRSVTSFALASSATDSKDIHISTRSNSSSSVQTIVPETFKNSSTEVPILSREEIDRQSKTVNAELCDTHAANVNVNTNVTEDWENRTLHCDVRRRELRPGDRVVGPSVYIDIAREDTHLRDFSESSSCAESSRCNRQVPKYISKDSSNECDSTRNYGSEDNNKATDKKQRTDDHLELSNNLKLNLTSEIVDIHKSITESDEVCSSSIYNHNYSPLVLCVVGENNASTGIDETSQLLGMNKTLQHSDTNDTYLPEITEKTDNPREPCDSAKPYHTNQKYIDTSQLPKKTQCVEESTDKQPSGSTEVQKLTSAEIVSECQNSSVTIDLSQKLGNTRNSTCQNDGQSVPNQDELQDNKSTKGIEMSDTYHSVDKEGENPKIKITDPNNISNGSTETEEAKTMKCENEGGMSRKPSKKDRSRQGIRRFTATVCLIDKTEGESHVMTPQRQRARSKSPIQLKHETCGTVESKQLVSVGHTRVSEICQSFLKKVNRTSPSDSTAERTTPTSPTAQSPALGKKLKWVNDCGKWKRVPVEDASVTVQIGHRQNNSTATESDVKTSIPSVREGKQLNVGSVHKSNTPESVTHTPSDVALQELSMSKKEIECKTTLNTDTKPKQPPKTLPKPSEETRRRTLGKSAVLKWTSFSQKRLSWRSENEKLNNVQSHKSESKPTEKHTEIFQTLEEKHIKSPTFENTDLSFTYDKGNVARKLNYEGDEFADRKSLTNTVNDKKIVTVEKLTNGQNKLTYGVQSLDAGDTQSSRKQTVQDTEFLTPATVQNDQSRKKIEQASIANLTEPSRFETKSTKQVTNDYQSINPGTTKSQEMPAPDAYYRGKEDDGIRDSEDDITPTNTPILRKIAASREYDDDVTPRNTPKLKAVKIKQEMFPREPTRLTKDSDVTYFRNGQYSACIGQVSADDGQPNMYDDTQKTENSQVNTDVNQPNEDDGQTDGHSDFGVKFYIDDDDSYDDNIVRRDGGRRRSDDRRRGVYGLGSIKDGDHCGDISVGNLSGLLTNGLLDAQCQDKLRNKEGPNKLLSEIVELEGNSLDGTSTGKSRFDEEELRNESCKTPVSPLNGSPCVNRSFSRSQSLPTSSLQGYGQPKIVYKNGHFVIETGLESQYEEEEEHISTKQESVQRPLPHVIGPKCKNTPNKDVCKSLTKRRSNSEADLLDKDMDDDEDDADVFLQNEGDITVIDNRRVEKSWHIHVKRRTKPLNDEEGGKSSRPASIDEGQLQWSVEDLRQNKMKPKKNNDIKRRSASFKELRSFKLKRNSSFREAQEKGTLMKQYGKNESMGNLSMSPSEISVTSEGRSRGILNRMFKRNKSFNDKGSIAANEQTLGRRDSSREIKNRKMSLKTLFGLKSKSDSSQQRGQDESMTTVSPPMAVFQSDMDINVIGSAPNSPYSSQKFHRRHTAADLYSNQSHTLPRRPSDIPKALTSSKDHSSVRSLNIQNLANHPMRPISPKPTGIVITRRNSNVSLPNSPLRDGSSDSRGSSLRASHNTLDSSDTVSTCSGNSTDLTPTSPPLGPDDSRCANASSPQDRERYTTLVQGGEMTSSNSNDSGIQRDVSINSSSESLKTIQDLSPTTVVRRRKSPSPRPERPKSEISVRWADLVETNEITPVKRRDSQSSHRQRPKSDLEDNLSMFDEMYHEVIEDFGLLSGGSSFSDEMRPFGSQLSLLPYSSLQSLDTLRRQDSFDQKPNKRRMSTPHPIKTRLERSPRKQKKRNPLVRSHSMPESLDKLYRKKRFFSTASSNLHKEEFLRGTFEDDSCSDDGSDYSSDQISLHEKSLSARSSTTYLSTLEERPEGDNLTYAEALWDHITMDQEELGFRAGDVIEVADMTDKDWWWGAIDDKEGWFPAAFVRLRVNQERLGEELSGRLEEVSEDSSPLLHRISVLNKEQARENVVNEILTAERDYVKHLRDVVEGYIKHARKRTDMFNEERIAVIFGNMEHIYNFSSEFLQKIEKAFQKDHPYLSELGQCFLHYSKDFEIYSDYCNNHPAASEELKDLYRKQKYRHFFEACRLLQEMVEIPLEGFLLTPVQKICKYPLQLSELLKYTPPSHPDHENVAGALAAMKKIAALINERKRKMESIEKLARWQTMVEDWQGADLIEESSELIMSGEMYKVNSAGWSQERNFFLFDHQLIYCKKDLLKRNGYSYRGRVDLDDCEIHPLEDGKESQYNVTVKNAWKLHEVVRDKWYLLYTKTETEKQKWLKAFNSERQRVKEDQENNFVPFEWKRTILNRIKSSQERGRRTPVPSSDFMRGIPSHATLPRSYSKKVQKKKGWFIFGNKKTK